VLHLVWVINKNIYKNFKSPLAGDFFCPYLCKMERQNIIEEIQQIIQNYGYMHCYEDIIGNCMPPKPNYLNLGTTKVVDGVFYDDGAKRGFIQGYHMNHVSVVFYKNAKPFDSFSINYDKLSLKYLTECLNFLRRK
jgi:hypothetical protein